MKNTEVGTSLLRFTPAVWPVLAVLMYVTIMPYLVSVLADCPSENGADVEHVTVLTSAREKDRESEKGNPLVCHNEVWWSAVKAVFNEAKAGFDSSKNTPTFVMASAAAEARGRLGWTIAVTLDITAGLFAIGATIAVMILAWRDVRSPLRPDQVNDIVAFALFLFGIFLAYNLCRFVASLMFEGILNIPEVLTGYGVQFTYMFRNNLMDYTREHVMPGIEKFWGLINIILSVASILLMIAVAVCVIDRRSEPTGVPEYARFLARAAVRLKSLLYIGAAMMAASIVQFHALYFWPVTLLQPPSNPGKDPLSSLIQSLEGYVALLDLGYGIVFSAFLLLLFVPANIVLGMRGRELADSLLPAGPAVDVDKWLKDRNLGFGFSGQVRQVGAMLIPAVVGAVGAVLQSYFHIGT